MSPFDIADVAADHPYIPYIEMTGSCIESVHPDYMGYSTPILIHNGFPFGSTIHREIYVREMIN